MSKKYLEIFVCSFQVTTWYHTCLLPAHVVFSGKCSMLWWLWQSRAPPNDFGDFLNSCEQWCEKVGYFRQKLLYPPVNSISAKRSGNEQQRNNFGRFFISRNIFTWWLLIVVGVPWSEKLTQKTPEMHRSRGVHIRRYFNFYATPNSRGDIAIWKYTKKFRFFLMKNRQISSYTGAR